MQTARITFLATPEYKATIEGKATRMGVSSGEFLRRAGDQYGESGEEEELAALTREVEAATPRMSAALDNSIAAIERASDRIDRLLRDIGHRA